MKLATFWHMHQPDYRDNSGVMQMPWVFLHSIKDYYDMPWMMSRHDGIKASFNITPPLIEQIKLYYDDPCKNDYFLNLWYKDSSELDQNQKEWMTKICKSAQFDTMVSPLPHFAYLYNKEVLSSNEFFDLEVLFILSWCGVYLKQNSKVVSSLITKQKNYDFNDKTALLNELKEFIKGIFDYYKSLHVKGLISISTTPLNHPILPLLLDMNNACKANPSTNIPHNHESLNIDANLQVSRAIDIFEDTFGFAPKGFWPAEGAVDQESVRILKEHGIKWIATDEAILFKSIENSDRKNLYYPYSYDDVCIGFRDHGLSDLIGFTYRFQEADNASDDFINALKNINDENNDATVFVILDGENAWEFYKNNGFDFFDALYNKLNLSPWCETVTMDEVCQGSKRKLPNLAPGSWINGEFNTWVGHSEKTKAWDLLFQTKRDYEKHANKLDINTKEEITKHFLAAECSDWFWWYGDDHYTDFGAEFDTLFRDHLIDIYNLMQISPPSSLFKSILERKNIVNFRTPPQSNISPIINGLHDSFFEWIGCGVIDETKVFSTMDRVRAPIHKILYGQDREFIYFAFSADIKALLESDILNIVVEPIKIDIEIPLKEGFGKIEKDLKVEYACKEWLEIKMDKKSFTRRNLSFSFELIKEKRVIQTLPSFRELTLDLDASYSKNWFI